MTPFDFSTLRTNHAAGETGHAAMHNDERRALKELGRHDRYAVYADDYASIQAALDAANTLKRTRVLLEPGKSYTITETITVPAGVTLDGGGSSYGGAGGAVLRAGAALDPMVRLSGRSGVRGCIFNGNNKQAAGGVFIPSVTGCVVESNLFTLFNVYAIRMGGALYVTLRHNAANNIDGWGVDAAAAHIEDEGAYYGVNVCLSECNDWKGGIGAVRFDGIITSIRDTFEMATSGEPVVLVGTQYQSQLTMYSPYMELTQGAGPIRAIKVAGSTRASIYGGQFFGRVEDTEAVFLDFSGGTQLVVNGCIISRFATVFDGYCTTFSHVSIHGNDYWHYQTLNGINGLATAASVFAVWPGTRIGV
jgi:hypothetical protein